MTEDDKTDLLVSIFTQNVINDDILGDMVRGFATEAFVFQRLVELLRQSKTRTNIVLTIRQKELEEQEDEHALNPGV